jgi:hypothetical protein
MGILGMPGWAGSTGGHSDSTAPVLTMTPVVTSIKPASGPTAGGTLVTITGSDLGTKSTATVQFGGVSVAPSIDNGTTIVVASPSGKAGTVDVTVKSDGGTSAISAHDKFTYIAAPVITQISPTAGPLAGGATETITGANFTGATVVAFGTARAANLKVVSSTKITATIPKEKAGTVNVRVVTPGGTSDAVTADQYTYVAAPTVTQVSPAAGPLKGGAAVTITGTNFDGPTAVYFGTVPATNVKVVPNTSNTEITATIPKYKAGTVNVTVTTVGGTSAISSSDQFLYLAPPSVKGVSPTAGPLGGGTVVTITGTNLGTKSTTTVQFGAVSVTPKSDNGTKIVVDSPSSTFTVTTPVAVTVTTLGGASAKSSSVYFVYTAAPAITALTAATSPAVGPAKGGTQVTITGTNLGTVSTAKVRFGSVEVTPTSDNGTTIVVKSPPMTVTDATGMQTVDVRVSTVGGTATAPQTFTYFALPTVTGVSPATGPLAGGLPVTITGTNFSGPVAVYFGTTRASGVTVVSDTEITATIPKGKAGTVNVTVTTVGGTSVTSTADKFTYAATKKAPAIITSGAIAADASDLALLALTGQSSPSATIQRKMVDNLMASLLT